MILVIFISSMVYCTNQKGFFFFLFPAPILCKTKVPDHRRSSQAKVIKMLEVCYDFLAGFICFINSVSGKWPQLRPLMEKYF